jgi:uncharacterized protein
MTDQMPDVTSMEQVEAAAFRRLLDHLRHRTDVQNVDLMGWGGFCRNCLSDWLADAAAERGVLLDKDAAREHVYGMAYSAYKAQFQTSASPEQLARMDASIAKNKLTKDH